MDTDPEPLHPTGGDTLSDRLTHHLPAIAVATGADGAVVIEVGAGVPALAVHPSTVRGLDPLTTPWGATAVRLDMTDPVTAEPTRLMVLEGDVAFAPHRAASPPRAGLVPRVVADMPAVIGYQDVVRLLAAAADEPDGDRLMGKALAAVAYVAGARRVGLDVEALQADLDAVVERAYRY